MLLTVQTTVNQSYKLTTNSGQATAIDATLDDMATGYVVCVLWQAKFSTPSVDDYYTVIPNTTYNYRLP